jgi:hypothetical protein
MDSDQETPTEPGSFAPKSSMTTSKLALPNALGLLMQGKACHGSNNITRRRHVLGTLVSGARDINALALYIASSSLFVYCSKNKVHITITSLKCLIIKLIL